MSDSIKNKPIAQQTFENRRATLSHLANLSPNRVSSAQIAELNNISIRAAQRALQDLSAWGYLKSDNNKPKGYWLNEEKRAELLAWRD